MWNIIKNVFKVWVKFNKSKYLNQLKSYFYDRSIGKHYSRIHLKYNFFLPLYTCVRKRRDSLSQVHVIEYSYCSAFQFSKFLVKRSLFFFILWYSTVVVLIMLKWMTAYFFVLSSFKISLRNSITPWPIFLL